MSQYYPVPAGCLTRETEVKKSRFIARIAPVADRADVRRLLAEARTEYPDARHICWAYQIGRPGAALEAAMNDDGEPSGTAGKPILGVIQHKDMGDVLVIVIRYFGGVKLGAGGLVRAYAGAAESVLSAVDRVTRPVLIGASLSLSFAQEQPLRHWAAQHDALVESVGYDTGATVQLQVPEDHWRALVCFCQAQGIRYHSQR
ncbi:MAG: YigZ family protein [Oleiphilaceae bacterium]|nr:YigZ family protein [Oleiphilaceae bacterium]